MKIEHGFSASCSESVVKLSEKTGIKVIKDILKRLEDITNWKVCFYYCNYENDVSAFFPVNINKVYLNVHDDGKYLAADINAIKSLDKTSKIKTEVYKPFFSKKDKGAYRSIVLANVEGDLINTSETFDNEPEYLSFYLNSKDLLDGSGFGIGNDNPGNKEVDVLLKVRDRLKGEITYDFNNVLRDKE